MSVTELEILKRCRWKWDKMSFSREGLTAIVTKRPLDLGSLMHQALFDWITQPDGDPVEFFNKRAQIRLVEMATAYKEAVGAGMSREELIPYGEAVRIGAAMMANYQAMYTTPLSPGWTLISAEQPCLVKIPGTYHNCIGPCLCSKCYTHELGLDCESEDCVCCCWHQLEGTLDGLVANERGDIWILEHKTWDRHPDMRQLYRNPQFARYMWIGQQLGLNPQGIAYDGLWSRATVPTGKKFEDLFLRRLITVNQHFIDQTGEYLAQDVNEAASLPAITKSIDWTCPNCGVYDLCESDSFGEDYDFILSTKYKKRERTPAFETEVS